MEITNVDVPSRYGAWAANAKIGVPGGAIDMGSLGVVKAQAIKTCERGGRDAPCKVVVWARNSCIAVAQGKFGKKWIAFPSIKGPSLAEADVLRRCQASGSSQYSTTANGGRSLPRF